MKQISTWNCLIPLSKWNYWCLNRYHFFLNTKKEKCSYKNPAVYQKSMLIGSYRYSKINSVKELYHTNLSIRNSGCTKIKCRTLPNDKGHNPSVRCTNSKCVCIQHQSLKIQKADNDKVENNPVLII